jgi:glycosyltransferase involved in cell wall biosynthesis
MRVIHSIPSIGPGSFGLGPVALNLCREQISLGVDSSIWCLDNENDLQWASSSSGLSSSSIRNFPITGPGMLRLSFAMERAACCEVSRETLIHQHGIWTGVSRTTHIMRRAHSVLTIVAPHGSLERWALKRSHWKKRLALLLYERSNLHNASCLHACSEQEIAGFRDFGLTNPIAVIPNGISNSWLESTGNAMAFRKQFSIPACKRIMLFLSRITPVKGLPLLIEAFNNIRHQMDGWVLVIAGSDEFDHKAEVQGKIRQLHMEDHILFTGLLVDQAKREAFAAADLFVLPTKREAAPVVVLEALGAGIPVLTTKGAPWENLLKYNCGWWTDVDSGAIAEALKDALNCSPEQLKQMGQRGKELVAAEYTWARSAQMTIELYEWLLGRKERPEFVVVD